MKILILFNIITVLSFASTTNLSFIKSHELFKTKNVLFESTLNEQSLIYATRTLQKEPKIVYSDKLIQDLKLQEIEKVLLFCHELGHFEAGAPYKKRGRTIYNSWSSSEGQADFYSTLICIKKFNLSMLKAKPVSNQEIIKEIEDLCSNHLENSCHEVLKGIYNLVKVYQSWTNESVKLSFFKTNLYPTYHTILGYPSNQCRLITLLNGYMCSEEDQVYSQCLDGINRRPRCWFSE